MFTKHRKAVVMAVGAVLISALLVGPARSTAETSARPDSSCSSSSPCLQWDNTKAGAGLKGTSARGNGLEGSTKSANVTHSGVLGTDASQSSSKNAGVMGVSNLGNGVNGLSGAQTSQITGSAAGVYGLSSLYYGVHGQVNSPNPGSSQVAGVFGEDLTSGSASSGVRGQSGGGVGVFGASQSNNGVMGTTNSTFASGVYGEAPGAGAYGVAGRATGNGIGVFADSASTFLPALLVQQDGRSCPDQCNDVIEAKGPNDPSDLLVLNTSGDLIVQGSVTQNASSRVVTPTSTGRKVISYAAQAAVPAIEDFGEAQLVGGEARVRLDPAFASAIDVRSPYLVFLTPQGPSGGLYVAEKTSTGFTVRETGNSRSSIAFDYRIVAKPYRSSAARLPLFEPPQMSHVRLPKAWRH